MLSAAQLMLQVLHQFQQQQPDSIEAEACDFWQQMQQHLTDEISSEFCCQSGDGLTFRQEIELLSDFEFGDCSFLWFTYFTDRCPYQLGLLCSPQQRRWVVFVTSRPTGDKDEALLATKTGELARCNTAEQLHRMLVQLRCRLLLALASVA